MVWEMWKALLKSWEGDAHLVGEVQTVTCECRGA